MRRKAIAAAAVLAGAATFVTVRASDDEPPATLPVAPQAPAGFSAACEETRYAAPVAVTADEDYVVVRERSDHEIAVALGWLQRGDFIDAIARVTCPDVSWTVVRGPLRPRVGAARGGLTMTGFVATDEVSGG